jgi:hypothetical protein
MTNDYIHAKRAKARNIAKSVDSQVLYLKSQYTDTFTQILIRKKDGTTVEIDTNSLSTSTVTEILSKYS